jgi:hypothetical protein
VITYGTDPYFWNERTGTDPLDWPCGHCGVDVGEPCLNPPHWGFGERYVYGGRNPRFHAQRRKLVTLHGMYAARRVPA